mmetsp:Transcript_18046/g.15766  ORF Transcript_18046/g.15766 Transcript_18046/m.15766 type:complete len:136 (-) Transcript_18046:2794-3201(-)
MAEPIFQIIKPKNYEFADQYHRVKTALAQAHPLGPNYVNTVYKTAKFGAGRKKGAKIPPGKKTAAALDPLSDPLSGPSTSNSTPKGGKGKESSDDGFFDPLSASSSKKKPAKKKIFEDDDDEKSYEDPFANPLAR